MNIVYAKKIMLGIVAYVLASVKSIARLADI